MAAVFRRTCEHAGSVRLGPECFVWGDPYTRSLPVDVEHNWLAIIGGLTWKLSREEYRWLEAAFIKVHLRCAMDRVVLGPDGKPVRDETGEPMMHRVMLPMPNWPKGCRPLNPGGHNGL